MSCFKRFPPCKSARERRLYATTRDFVEYAAYDLLRISVRIEWLIENKTILQSLHYTNMRFGNRWRQNWFYSTSPPHSLIKRTVICTFHVASAVVGMETISFYTHDKKRNWKLINRAKRVLYNMYEHRDHGSYKTINRWETIAQEARPGGKMLIQQIIYLYITFMRNTITESNVFNSCMRITLTKHQSWNKSYVYYPNNCEKLIFFSNHHVGKKIITK